MSEPDESSKARYWLYSVPAFCSMIFLIAFWKEIKLSGRWLINLFQLIFAIKPIFLWLNTGVQESVAGQLALRWDAPTAQAFTILSINCLVGVFTFTAMIFWVAQFVLPARSMDERGKAANRLLRYLLHRHGPAIFVKEGKILADSRETNRKYPGVALVDLKSAIVLESSEPARVVSPDLSSDEVVEDLPVKSPIFSVRRGKKSRPKVEAHGPGLVFTRRKQSVRGAVDLRKQIRVRATPKVDAYTRDGIRVESAVFAIFSLSEEPDTIPVTYVGDIREKNIENVYAIILDKRKNTSGVEQEIVADLYRLNPEDANEVLQNYDGVNNHANGVSKKSDARCLSQTFVFDAERVIPAVYYPPYHSGGQAAVAWDELPTMVAVEEYRNVVAKFTFDYMHMPDDPDQFPLKKIKQEFAFGVRSRGLMRYEMVFRADGLPITAGSIWDRNSLRFSSVRDLRNPQILRKRGIKVIGAGFGELMPASEVRKELINNWRARYEKEINSKLAKRDLEAARIRNRAIVKSQQDESAVLSDVLSSRAPDYSEEALTVRVFQALETAATDLSGSRLLPHDTINILWSLYQWMIREDEKPAGSNGTIGENLPG